MSESLFTRTLAGGARAISAGGASAAAGAGARALAAAAILVPALLDGGRRVTTASSAGDAPSSDTER